MTLSTRTIRYFAGLVVLFAASASCDLVAPRDDVARGTFALVVPAGPDPAITAWTDGDERLQILADTLRFEGSSMVQRALAFRRVRLSLGTVELHHLNFEMEYRLRGMTLEMGSFQPCPPNASCVANDVGTYDAATGTINLTTYRFGARAQVVFARIPGQ